MRTESTPAGELLEIACDESGSEGEKLIGGETDVFAHASVLLDTEFAAECIQQIRDRIRSPALEYKANHLLRKKHRAVLMWLLAPSGPIHGNAHVFLTDKTFFVVGRLVEFVAEVTDRRTRLDAGMLHRAGQRLFGRDRWELFLEAFNDLMRVTRRGTGISVEEFLRTVDELRLASTPGEVRDLLDLLWRAGPRIEAFRARLVDNPTMIPALDPLIPAFVETVGHWSAGGRAVAIVHDEQPSLTEERITQLKEILGASPRRRLVGLRFVDSRSDPRVQVADFLAGVARKIASDELNGRGDAELTALLRPFVDPLSVWGDNRSWTVLGPTSQESPVSVSWEHAFGAGEPAPEVIRPFTEHHAAALDPDRHDPAEAGAWLAEHRDEILAAVRACDREGLRRHGTRLAYLAWPSAGQMRDPAWWEELARAGEELAINDRDPGMLADLLHRSAATFAEHGDRMRAEERWVRALAIIRRDLSGPDDPEHRDRGVAVLTRLGAIYRGWGRLSNALDADLGVVDLRRAAGDAIGTARALAQVAATMRAAGRPGSAADYLAQADEEMTPITEDPGCAPELLTEHARILVWSGRGLWAEGRHGPARRRWSRALAMLVDVEEDAADQVRALLATAPEDPLPSGYPPDDGAETYPGEDGLPNTSASSSGGNG